MTPSKWRRQGREAFDRGRKSPNHWNTDFSEGWRDAKEEHTQGLQDRVDADAEWDIISTGCPWNVGNCEVDGEPCTKETCGIQYFQDRR